MITPSHEHTPRKVPYRFWERVGEAGADLWVKTRGLLRRFFVFLETWLTSSSKNTYGVSVARMGLGATALLLLVANFQTRLYSFGSGIVWSGERINPVSDFPKIPLFSAFYAASLNDGAFTALYVVLMALCVVVILGYRMKVTLIVFGVLWVSFIEVTDFIGDQGDNIFRMAIIAMLFMDTSAVWSLDARRRDRFSHRASGVWGALRYDCLFPAWMRNTAHNLGLVVLTCQISFIYVAGSLYKAGGRPWFAGEAIYSPIHVGQFGTWPLLSDIVTAWDPIVGALTYGALLTQLSFPFLLLNTWTRKIGIIAITGTHVGIGIIMGLPFFSLTMIALDMIFVTNTSWRIITEWFKNHFGVTSDRVFRAHGEHVNPPGHGGVHPAKNVSDHELTTR